MADDVAARVAKLVGAYSTGLENALVNPASPEAIALLRKWMNFGWQFRVHRTGNTDMVKRKQEYIERAEYELELIISKNFVDYFMVTSDIVRWAKDNKIPVGPGRGSAAASLVCYLLRITEVDPLQHPNMLFERFIDPTRTEAPDIDLDFDDERRHEVFEYAASKYGAGNVGHIANFTRYRGKNSLDDVARVYQIPKWEVETVKGLIIERSGGDSRLSDSLEDTFATFPKAREVLERYPELGNAIKLEGNYRGMGVHAAGLVIANAPINDFCATYTRNKDGRDITVIAYDKKDAAYVGFLKQDILGLATMGMIGHALNMIDMDLEDLYRVPLTDTRTLEAFRNNDVTGIFQFEGRATRLVCRDVKPDHFQHLADINALSRPGPLFSGMAAAYIDVKHNRQTIEHYHPIVDEYAGWTYGQIIYQEQVLRIIRDLGGFPMTKIHAIRQIISQKLGEAQFDEMYKEFEENACSQHGCTPAQARRIWRFMATSATYSFNVAHCISYSMLAFWQMWLKVHHPTAFYAAQLRKTPDETRRNRLLKDAMRHGITVAPPDLLDSDENWTAPDTNTVCAGFRQIPGIGPKTATAIVNYLEDMDWSGPLPDWDDLLEIKGIGPSTINKIADFVDNPDPFGLKVISNRMVSFRKWLLDNSHRYYLPNYTHETSDDIPREGTHEVVWAGIPQIREYKDYIEDERARTGKDVDEILANMRDPDLLKGCVLKCVDDGDDECYCRVNRWTFPKLQEQIESINLGKDIVLFKGVKRDGFGVSIQVRDMWVMQDD